MANCAGVAVPPDHARRAAEISMSDAVDWNRVKQLFQEALERSPADRPAFLRNLCASDDVLLHEVQSLLDAHEDAGAFAEQSPWSAVGAPSGTASSGATQLQPGDRVGSYEIREWIGAGGMGEVYRASDP